MTMRKLILMIALVIASLYQASASRMWIEGFSIKAGETKEIPIYLTMDEEKLYVATQFDVYLPDGVTVDTDEGEYMFSLDANRITINMKNFTISHTLASNYEGGRYTVVVYSTSATDSRFFKGTSGVFATMTVTASADVTVGNYEAKLKNVMLSKDNATSDDTDEDPFDIAISKEATITLGANGYSTYCGDNNFTVTSGNAQCYTAAYNSVKGSVAIEEIAEDAVIPAGEGVLLKGDAAGETVTLLLTPETAQMLTDNELIGVNAETTSIASNPYVLASKDTETAFVKGGSYGTITKLMNKAYMSISGSNPASIPLSIEDSATAIDGMNGTDGSHTGITKFVGEKGEIVIDAGGKARYSTSGKRTK